MHIYTHGSVFVFYCFHITEFYTAYMFIGMDICWVLNKDFHLKLFMLRREFSLFCIAHIKVPVWYNASFILEISSLCFIHYKIIWIWSKKECQSVEFSSVTICKKLRGRNSRYVIILWLSTVGFFVDHRGNWCVPLKYVHTRVQSR